MTRIAAIALLAAALCASTASAAELTYQQFGSAIAFYLDGQELNGQFNVADVLIEPVAPTTIGTSLVPVPTFPPGQPYSYVNPMLSQAPLDGGQGWSILGETIVANKLAFAGGPLGLKIDTSSQPDGNLFLANVQFNDLAPGGFKARVQLIEAGLVVADLKVPEPTTGVLGVGGILALVAAFRVRRNY